MWQRWLRVRRQTAIHAGFTDIELKLFYLIKICQKKAFFPLDHQYEADICKTIVRKSRTKTYKYIFDPLSLYICPTSNKLRIEI